MFYVGQQFTLRDGNARYTITRTSAAWLYFRCQPAPGSYSFDTSFTRPQWQEYIRTGEVIPVVPIEPPTVAEYLANLTMDDVFERELGRGGVRIARPHQRLARLKACNVEAVQIRPVD